ncbi:hypothetical protein M0811_06984 [Anaeramoeba ignava]|uniref:Uncharacterized protein n=1 Tax=Anaeramoeba ignava TaxID=1746090 RepID=A0A9Q0RDG6_ANAIG|nr:hypothetical protein M0811_06984 [Anaeramoeba ignava]
MKTIIWILSIIMIIKEVKTQCVSNETIRKSDEYFCLLEACWWCEMQIEGETVYICSDVATATCEQIEDSLKHSGNPCSYFQCNSIPFLSYSFVLILFFVLSLFF